jgi:peroxiredoxin Q/BCP
VLQVGSEAPEFEAPDQFGEQRTLRSLLEDGRHLVLYFYPKDFTFVCTKEACLFRDHFEEIAEAGGAIAGVSADDVDSHERFASAHQLPFPLLSDPERKIASDFEITRRFGLMAKRVTYVIAPDRKVVGVLHHELSAAKHLAGVKRVLAAQPPMPPRAP